MTWNLDNIIFISFLLTTFLVGLYSARGVDSIRSFSVGNKNFHTSTLVTTIVATWISGEFFFTIVYEAYSSGIVFMGTALIGDFLGLFLIGWLFAPRMKRFLDNISIAEAMGNLYGSIARKITAFAGCLTACSIIAIQLKISGIIFNQALGGSELLGILISGIIIVSYTSLGGIRSVTITDFVQFITFCIVLPAITYLLFSSTESNDAVKNVVNYHDLFDTGKAFSFSNPEIYYFISLFLWGAIPSFNPTIFQRFLMSNSTKQAQNSFVFASYICMMLAILVSWIGILLLTHYPEIASKSESEKDVLSHIINHPALVYGFKGFILAGVMAMIMSTVDSYINSCSILVIYDLIGNKYINTEKQNDPEQIKKLRLCSLIIGFVAIAFALQNGSFLEHFLWASMFYMPVVSVPFIMAVFGFRTSKEGVLLAMASGFLCAISWEYWCKNSCFSVGGLLPGMLANFVIMLVSSLFYNIKPNYNHRKKSKQLPSYNIGIFDKIESILSISFIKKNTPDNIGQIAIMGIFIIVSNLIGISTVSRSYYADYGQHVYLIYLGCLIISTSLISSPVWYYKTNNKNLLSLFWSAALIFCLVGFSFFSVLISNFSETQMMVFMINLFLLIIVIDWQLSVLYGVLGILLAFLLNTIVPIQQSFDFDLSHHHLKVVYLLFSIGLVVVGFLKPKQQYELDKAKKSIKIENKLAKTTEKLLNAKDHKNSFLATVQHELNLPLQSIGVITHILQHYKDKTLPEHHLEAALEAIEDGSSRLQILVSNLLQSAAHERGTIEFHFKDADIIKTINESIKKYEDKVDIIFNHTSDKQIISHDTNQVRNIFNNLFKDAYRYSEDQKVTVNMIDLKHEIFFEVVSPGNPLLPGEEERLFEIFYQGSVAKSTQKGVGLGLYLCHKIVMAHKGRIWTETTPDSFGVHFSLPK